MAADSTYNKQMADYAVNFIECLCHTKGTWAGKPFELIDWQEQIIRDIFGTLKPNGYRQFNTAYVEIPKKMGFTLVPFGQGFKDMSPPTKELMKLTLEQKLAHGGHPVLRWMMDNIYIRTDPAGNIKADKEKSYTVNS